MPTEILDEIREMSVEQRLRLIGEIWDTIAEDPENLQLTREQEELLDIRLEAHRKDPSAGAPWDEVKREIRAHL